MVESTRATKKLSEGGHIRGIPRPNWLVELGSAGKHALKGGDITGVPVADVSIEGGLVSEQVTEICNARGAGIGRITGRDLGFGAPGDRHPIDAGRLTNGGTVTKDRDAIGSQ